MVDNVINHSPKSPSVETRECGRDANQGRRVDLTPVGGVSQTKVLQNIEVRLADNMMRLVDDDELEARRVELGQAIAGCDALDRGNSDVGRPRRMAIAHFDVDMLVRVGERAVAGCLLDKLAAVGENERLRG